MIPRFLAQASSMEFPAAEQACKETRVCKDVVEFGDGYNEFAMPMKQLVYINITLSNTMKRQLHIHCLREPVYTRFYSI